MHYRCGCGCNKRYYRNRNLYRCSGGEKMKILILTNNDSGLYQFRKELEGYSRIISYAGKLKRCRLYPLCQHLFPLLSLPIKARLTGNKPSIFLFNIYKLLYYIHLDI